MKKTTLIISFTFIVCSCTDMNYESSQLKELNINEKIIIKERNPEYPWSQYDYKSLKKQSLTRTTKFKDYLGYGWKGPNFFDSYSKFLTFPVIDTKRLFEDFPGYYSNPNINESKSNYFSFANFERYVEKSKTINKISSGLNLNLVVFSIGSKNTYNETFTNNITNESKAVFGEYFAEFAGDFYSMQYSTNIHDKILNNYLHKNFIEELYSTTPEEIYHNYGGFVLSNFITGGRAIAIYAGLYKGTETETSKESDMNNDIDASVGFDVQGDKDGSITGNLGFGKNFSNGKSYTGNFTNLQVSVKTLGGSADFAGFSSPKDVNNINLNISPWLSSLSDRSSHVIIDIAENGLIPLSDFIPEENLKRRFIKCIETGNSSYEHLIEPYLDIIITPLNVPRYGVKSELVTRYGERIPLRSYMVLADAVGNAIKEETKRLTKYFGLKIISNPFYVEPTSNVLNIVEITNLSTLKKVVDKDSKTILLLDDLNFLGKGKTAYVIRLESIIDAYAFRDFLDSLKTTEGKISDIQKNYRLIAL